MNRSTRVDGFQTLIGALALATAPLFAAGGAPAGWSFLLFAAGVILLLVQAVTKCDIDFDAVSVLHLVVAVFGLVCVGIAVIYLTRVARHLPTFFPGHDADSQHLRVTPGLLAAIVGSVTIARAIATSRPARVVRAPAKAEEAPATKCSSRADHLTREQVPRGVC
jgi:hypothetical protein